MTPPWATTTSRCPALVGDDPVERDPDAIVKLAARLSTWETRFKITVVQEAYGQFRKLLRHLRDRQPFDLAKVHLR